METHTTYNLIVMFALCGVMPLMMLAGFVWEALATRRQGKGGGL